MLLHVTCYHMLHMCLENWPSCVSQWEAIQSRFLSVLPSLGEEFRSRLLNCSQEESQSILTKDQPLLISCAFAKLCDISTFADKNRKLVISFGLFPHPSNYFTQLSGNLGSKINSFFFWILPLSEVKVLFKMEGLFYSGLTFSSTEWTCGLRLPLHYLLD